MIEAPTLTLRDYLVPVMKRRWMIAAVVVVITGIVSAYYARRPLTYTASTKVFIGPTSDPALGVGPSEPTLEAVSNQATLLTSTEDAAVVAKKIGYTGSAAGLAGSVTATPSATTNFLTIAADASTSSESARIANGFAQQFIEQNTASQVANDNRQIATLRKQIKTLKSGPQNAGQRETLQSQVQQLQVAASSSGWKHRLKSDPALHWRHSFEVALGGRVRSACCDRSTHRRNPAGLPS